MDIGGSTGGAKKAEATPISPGRANELEFPEYCFIVFYSKGYSKDIE